MHNLDQDVGIMILFEGQRGQGKSWIILVYKIMFQKYAILIGKSQRSIIIALSWSGTFFCISTSFSPPEVRICYLSNNLVAYNFQQETRIAMLSVGDWLRFRMLLEWKLTHFSYFEINCILSELESIGI